MRFGLYILFISLQALCQVQGQPDFLNPSQKSVFSDSDRFLKDLGFEDFVAQIKETKSESKKISAVSQLALNRSEDYLQSINGARNLANLTYTLLTDIQQAHDKDQVAKLELIRAIITQQLLPFPLLTSEPLTAAQIDGLKRGPVSDAIERKKAILSTRAIDRFFAEKLNLIKSYLYLIHPRPEMRSLVTAWLDSTITDAIIDPYTVQKRQQNRFLGRALVVSYVRYLRKQGDLASENELKLELRKQHLYIENYVNAYYVTEIENGEIRGVDLKSGDTAFEYSHGQEAFFTSLLIQPQKSDNKVTSEKYHLTNSVLDSYRFLDDKKYYDILDKKDTYRTLTSGEQQLYNDFWNKKYAHGFSHSGHVEVRKDEVSQISVAWIWDIYPEKDKIGPVRLMSPEGFSYPERMLKIAFLRYDPKKLFASFKKQIASRGFLQNIWTGYASFVGKYQDGETGPSLDLDGTYNWPTKIDESTVQSWTLLADQDSNDWYEHQILPRVFARFKNYLVSSEAKLFADGLVSAQDMLYCSQLITIAYLEAANLDLQSHQDEVWEVLKYLNSSIKSTLKINLNHRLVSPNGLIWQSEIVDRLQMFYLDRSRVALQERQTNPTVAASYTNLLESLKSVRETQVENPNKLLSLKLEAIQLDLEN